MSLGPRHVLLRALRVLQQAQLQHHMASLQLPLPQLQQHVQQLSTTTPPAAAEAWSAQALHHHHQHHRHLHHHPPRRACMYTPGSAAAKLRKAVSEVRPDCLVMDLEDGVAASTEAKAAARDGVVAALNELDFSTGVEAAVRINPVAAAAPAGLGSSSSSTSSLAAQDLQAVLSAARLPDALVVPKVESAAEVVLLMDLVQQLLCAQQQQHQHQRPRVQDAPSATGLTAARNSSNSSSSSTSSGSQRPRPMALITMCESALSLLNLRGIFEAAAAHPAAAAGELQLQTCILGGDDMAASLAATRSPGNEELAFARSAFLITCRAFAVQPIDIVKIDLSEGGMTALAGEARSAALHGFAGKQVIHPKQVPVVQAAFSPSDADVAAALALVAAYQQHQAAGVGAFVWQGRMIDSPTVLQARNVLALAERLQMFAS